MPGYIKSLKNIALCCTLILSVSLLMASMGRYVDPRQTVIFAFFGLAFPYLFPLCAASMLFWLIFSSRYALIPLVPVLAGLFLLPDIFRVRTENPADTERESLKLLSWNVRLFDLYNWSHNKDTRDKMFELIRKENADVICLQEFFNSDQPGYFTTLDTLLKLQQARYYHVAYTRTVKQVYHYGLAIFSKYPITEKGRVRTDAKPLNSSNDCIYADILYAGDTVRIYNMHLASIRFDRNTYKFMDNIGMVKGKQRIEGIYAILRQLRQAFVQRAEQLDTVIRHIGKSKHAVIACADLNDSPSSNAYHRLGSLLNDAFKTCGRGWGITYHGRFPGFRIDYILTSKELKTTYFETLADTLSDHHPLVGKIALSP